MSTEEYVLYLGEQMMRRPIDKETQMEIRRELRDMVKDNMTLGDIRFVVNVKWGALFKSNVIEF